jgi:predicted nucleic acid-binding protein
VAKKRRKGNSHGPAFVLDGSITLVWAFEDETDAYAESVLDSLGQASAIVPAVWPLEVANALLMGQRRQRISEATVAQFLALLQTLRISVDGETVVRAWQETLHLARLHNLTVYDAAYLEVAVRLGLPLASLDDNLNAAATAAGVPAFAP